MLFRDCRGYFAKAKKPRNGIACCAKRNSDKTAKDRIRKAEGRERRTEEELDSWPRRNDDEKLNTND